MGIISIFQKISICAPMENPQKLQAVSLPELNYGYASLEPTLIADILEVHHKKHHNAYANNYNNLIEKLCDAASKGEAQQVQNLCAGVAFNAGGYNTHNIYFENLAPAGNPGGLLPDENSPFTKEIVKYFGSYDNFKKAFNAKTAGIKGSGWGWLGYDPVTKSLTIEQTVNQDHVECNGLVPLLTVDVWEHAYYLQYKNSRPDYLDKIWNVINWNVVVERWQKN